MLRSGVLSISAALLALAAGCSPQVNGGGTVTIHNKQSSTVSSSGGDVGIDNGSKVSVPAGALAVGSQVTVQKVAAPSEFGAAGAAEASSPVEITGKNADGTAVSHASQPMTVNLVLNGASSLALAVDKSVDNLCVLLKASGSAGLFVWRHASLTYDDAAKAVQIKSLFFGVFQVVYCGADPLTGGFADASLQGATGEPRLAASITIPAGFDADLGAGKVCVAVVRDDVKTKQACTAANQALPPGQPPKDCPDVTPVLGVGEQSLQSGSANTGKADFPSTQLVEGQDTYVGAFLTDAGAACPLKQADNFGSIDKLPGVKSFYAFKVAPAQLKAGLSGVLGETGSAYQFTTVSLALGGPGDLASYAKFEEPTVCLESDLANGHGLRLVSFASGTIAGKNPFPVQLPTGVAGVTGKADLRVHVGQDCGAGLGDKVSGDPKTGKPYWVTLRGGNATQYLTPVTLHLTLSNSAEGALNACLEIAAPGGFTGGAAPIGRMLLSLAQPTYQIYLPYLADPAQQKGGLPKYDMRVTLLDAGGDCQNRKSSSPPIVVPNKVLNPDIEVQL